MAYMKDKAGRRLDSFEVEKRGRGEFRAAARPYSENVVMASPPTITVGGSATALTSPTTYDAFRRIVVTTVNASTALVATTGTFEAEDVGKTVAASSGLVAGATIVSVESPTNATMSAAATASATGKGITIERPNEAFRYLGTPTVVRAASTFPTNGMTATPTETYSLADSYAVEFSHYGQSFEFITFATSGATTNYRLWVDTGRGWESNTAAPVAGPTGTSTTYVLVDFGSVGNRRIRIEMDNAFKFGGVVISGTGHVWAGDAPGHVRAVFAGDSYFEGRFGANVSRWNAIWGTVAKNMGWGDPHNRGQAGTGYLNNGSSVRATNTTLRPRIPAIVALKPDQLVVALGVNDTSFTGAQVQAEAALCYADVKAGLPYVPVYIVGPWNAPSLNAATLLDISNGLKTAAIAAGFPYANPQTGDIWAGDGTLLVKGRKPWIEGNASSTTLNGGAFMHTDNLHLKQAGNEYVASRITAFIRTVQEYKQGL